MRGWPAGALAGAPGWPGPDFGLAGEAALRECAGEFRCHGRGLRRVESCRKCLKQAEQVPTLLDCAALRRALGAGEATPRQAGMSKARPHSQICALDHNRQQQVHVAIAEGRVVGAMVLQRTGSR